MKESERNTLRQSLEARAAELVELIAEQRHSVEDTGEMEAGGADRGEESNHEFEVTLALSQAEQESRELEAVQHALQALESGEYGFCESCSESIPVLRLLANPAATRCVTCQELAERDFDERDATPSL